MFLLQSPFNMRQYNLSVLRPPVSKSGPGSTAPKTTMSYKTAAQSLDLLRQNIQRSINQEIQTVISKYIDVSNMNKLQTFLKLFIVENHTVIVTNQCSNSILEYPKPSYLLIFDIII